MRAVHVGRPTDTVRRYPPPWAVLINCGWCDSRSILLTKASDRNASTAHRCSPRVRAAARRGERPALVALPGEFLSAPPLGSTSNRTSGIAADSDVMRAVPSGLKKAPGRPVVSRNREPLWTASAGASQATSPRAHRSINSRASCRVPRRPSECNSPSLDAKASSGMSSTIIDGRAHDEAPNHNVGL